MPEPVMNSEGKIIGSLDSGIFIKRVQGSKHMLRKPPAWAVDSDVLALIRDQASQIFIEDMESGKVYRVTLSLFEEKAIAINRGFGPQKALLLKYWSTGDDKQKRLF